MALELSLDLQGATLGDLEAFVAAARSAGAQANSEITFAADDGVVSVRAQASRRTPHNVSPGAAREHVGGVGEAAVRSVIDILTGRQEPPRQ